MIKNIKWLFLVSLTIMACSENDEVVVWRFICGCGYIKTVVVPINIQDPLPGENYIGTYNELPIAFIGLENGIKNVFDRLK